MSPQNKKVLQRLREKGCVDMVEAANELYIHRLSERIRELKKEGYEVKSERVLGKPYQRYSLVSEPKVSDNESKEWSKFGKPIMPTSNSPTTSEKETANASDADEPRTFNVPTFGEEPIPQFVMTQKIVSPSAILATMETPKDGSMKNRENTENLCSNGLERKNTLNLKKDTELPFQEKKQSSLV